jgi:hypothetical protein
MLEAAAEVQAMVHPLPAVLAAAVLVVLIFRGFRLLLARLTQAEAAEVVVTLSQG